MLNTDSKRILNRLKAIKRSLDVLSLEQKDNYRFVIRVIDTVKTINDFSVDKELFGTLFSYKGKLKNIEVFVIKKYDDLPHSCEEIHSAQLTKKILHFSKIWKRQMKVKMKKYIAHLYGSDIGQLSFKKFLDEEGLEESDIESIVNHNEEEKYTVKSIKRCKAEEEITEKKQREIKAIKRMFDGKYSKPKKTLNKTITKKQHLLKLEKVNVYDMKIGTIIETYDSKLFPETMKCQYCHKINKPKELGDNDLEHGYEDLTEEEFAYLIEQNNKFKEGATQTIENLTQFYPSTVDFSSQMPESRAQEEEEFKIQENLIERGFKVNSSLAHSAGIPVTKQENRLNSIYKRYDSLLNKIANTRGCSRMDIMLPSLVTIRYNGLANFNSKESSELLELYEKYMNDLSTLKKTLGNDWSKCNEHELFKVMRQLTDLTEKINTFIGSHDANYSKDVIENESRDLVFIATSTLDKQVIQDTNQVMDFGNFDFNIDSIDETLSASSTIL